jgi:di/tricarboxylate transporter
MMRKLSATRIAAALTTIAGLVLLAAPGLTGLADATGRAMGVTLIAAGLWGTAVVPAYFTSILFMFLAVALAIAPARVVFSGFQSTAVWLVFGGLVLGVAVQKTGLGARAVRAMLRSFPLSYRGIVWAVALTGVALALFIPSASGRVVLLMPIVIALADRLGFAPGRPGRTGLVLAAGLGTTIPAFGILPANVPNMALIGAAESIYDAHFTYGGYLALNFPVMGVLSALAIPTVVSRMFPDTATPAQDADEYKPWSGEERRLMVVLAIGLALWATDFLHHISPAWVAMGAAILCVLPAVGALKPASISKDVDYGPWLFVAGVIGLGAVVTHSGLGAAVARSLFSVVPLSPGDGPLNFAIMYGVGAVTAVLTTVPASPGILTPLAQGIADASGWPLHGVLMAQVPVWFLFPFAYQAPPIVLTLVMGQVSPRRALKVMLPLMVFGIAVILPLQYLWGRLLGVYP